MAVAKSKGKEKVIATNKRKYNACPVVGYLREKNVGVVIREEQAKVIRSDRDTEMAEANSKGKEKVTSASKGKENALLSFDTDQHFKPLVDGDIQQWDSLSVSEKHFISHMLAFFATSDGIVLENLAARFLTDVQITEARALYGFQLAMENIHSEMYSLLLETYIKDTREKHRLFNAIENILCVAEKAKWALEWIQRFSSMVLLLSCHAIFLWVIDVPGLELLSSRNGIHWRGNIPKHVGF
ncbi:hypothetical protein Vadar_011908 [Vaccinium darrowii]|uniref:Uncharacterized protein n=1 Tax=Vaccinium darrowii TaxID=229202 RepID=A0ACB7ZK21_9ERIC|nr:hypothetical protein Vadar_011908 [Vaccinium darrowii]